MRIPTSSSLTPPPPSNLPTKTTTTTNVTTTTHLRLPPPLRPATTTNSSNSTTQPQPQQPPPPPQPQQPPPPPPQQQQQTTTTTIDPLHTHATMIATTGPAPNTTHMDVYSTYGFPTTAPLLYTTTAVQAKTSTGTSTSNGAPSPLVSTIVTGPNGQPMILGPSATATLLQQHHRPPNPQPYLTSAGSSTSTTTGQPQPQQRPLTTPTGAVPVLTPSSSSINTPPTAALLVSAPSAPIAPDFSLSQHHLRVAAIGGSTTTTAATATNGSIHNNNTAALTPEERRRQERNLREQQRSHRISQQICELKNVLVESNVPFKPNKFNVLMSVVEYIKQLQARAVFLDGEHQKLIQTIQQTTNYVSSNNTNSNSNNNNNHNHNTGNNNSNPNKRTVAYDNNSNVVGVDNHKKSRIGNDADLLFVQGLDYQAVFSQCNAPLGVAALDGRFLACNLQFQILTGYTQDQLNRFSLFNLVKGQDVEQVFKVMGEMLKSKPNTNNNSNNNNSIQSNNKNKNGNSNQDTSDIKSQNHHSSSSPTYWTGLISHYHNNKPNLPITLNITLARTDDGIPKFFNCALFANQ